MTELQNYEENRRIASQPPDQLPYQLDKESMGVIPVRILYCFDQELYQVYCGMCFQANTQLQTTIYVEGGGDSPCIELALNTSNDTLIRTFMVFAEGIFQGESHVV